MTTSRASKILLLVILFCVASITSAWDEHGREHHDRPLDARLFDATGKPVGKVVYAWGGFPFDGGVILRINGVSVYAGVSWRTYPNGSVSSTELKWAGVYTEYASPNCSGAPLVPYASGPLRPTSLRRRGDTATLYIASGAPTQTVAIGSMSDSGSCEVLSGESQWAYAVESAYDLTQNYPEPLHIGF